MKKQDADKRMSLVKPEGLGCSVPGSGSVRDGCLLGSLVPINAQALILWILWERRILKVEFSFSFIKAVTQRMRCPWEEGAPSMVWPGTLEERN